MRRAKILATLDPAGAGHITPASPTTTQLHRVVGGAMADLEITEADGFPRLRDDQPVNEAVR
jgi:hypothetical protein